MKRLLSLLLILTLIIGMSMLLTGCDRDTASVSSMIDIDQNFAGTRTVTVAYPLSTEIDEIKDTLVADAPTAEIDGAEFTYQGVKEDGYYFDLVLTFSDKAQYEEIVGELIGRGANAFLSCKNTYLTKGTRMAEDFDVSELVSWVVSDTAAADATKNTRFDFAVNQVRIGSDIYDTGSTVSINDCQGSTINSIALKTSNDKAGSYSRTFTFSVPNETYSADKEAIEKYFLTNTDKISKYSGWSSEGTNMIYTVIYEDLSADKLDEVTSMLLDTDSVEIFYGDKDNSSTPLSEGLTYEESLDAFSFIGPDGGFPKLEYAYSLPLSTTHGDGSIFEDGRWVSAGAWNEGVYEVTLDKGAATLRIPDGIQYSVTGINFGLTSLGDSRFRRSTEFLYAKEDGREGSDYAQSYFTGKGAESEVTDDGENYVCRVAFEGTTEEVTAQLVKMFGSGNFLAYEQSAGTFSLSIKTELTDYVNLGYMLNADNASVPMTYHVGSEGGDTIVSVSIDGTETAYTEHSECTMPVKEGCATVVCHGNIPIVSHIVLYCVLGLILLTLTAFVCIRLMMPKKKKKRDPDPLNNPEAVYEQEETSEDDAEESGSSEPSAASPLSQTTTFSIFELGALSRNKKYVDEINKDVEQRMREQSLEEQKQDIRARELEEMSRKVYGSDEDAEEAADEASKTTEDAPSTEEATENTPEAPDQEENSND